MTKILKRIIVALCILLVVLFAAGILAGNYFYTLALDPTADKSILLADEDDENSIVIKDPNAEANKEWFESVGYTDDFMESGDGLLLHAYVLQHKETSPRWVVILHGYGGSGSQMRASARQFYDAGYNVLLPDARGHGDSEGNYIGMGWPERLDVVQWLNRLNSLHGEMNIELALYGASMGGATVMMTAGEVLPGNVVALVEDCGYTSVKDELAYQLKSLFNLPSFPLLNFADLITQIRAGYSLFDASAVKQLEKATKPMLFIHGSADTFVPAYMLDIVYDAAPVEKEKFLVEGANHGMSYLVAGDVYWDTVFEFIDKYSSCVDR